MTDNPIADALRRRGQSGLQAAVERLQAVTTDRDVTILGVDTYRHPKSLPWFQWPSRGNAMAKHVSEYIEETTEHEFILVFAVTGMHDPYVAVWSRPLGFYSIQPPDGQAVLVARVSDVTVMVAPIGTIEILLRKESEAAM